MPSSQRTTATIRLCPELSSLLHVHEANRLLESPSSADRLRGRLMMDGRLKLTASQLTEVAMRTHSCTERCAGLRGHLAIEKLSPTPSNRKVALRCERRATESWRKLRADLGIVPADHG